MEIYLVKKALHVVLCRKNQAKIRQNRVKISARLPLEDKSRMLRCGPHQTSADRQLARQRSADKQLARQRSADRQVTRLLRVSPWRPTACSNRYQARIPRRQSRFWRWFEFLISKKPHVSICQHLLISTNLHKMN